MRNITSIVLSLLVTCCLLADGVAQEAETTDPPRLALEAGGHTAVVKRVLFRPSGDEVEGGNADTAGVKSRDYC